MELSLEIELNRKSFNFEKAANALKTLFNYFDNFDKNILLSINNVCRNASRPGM